MVLADADEIDPDLVGKDCLVEHVADDLGLMEQLAIRAAGTSPNVSMPNSIALGIWCSAVPGLPPSSCQEMMQRPLFGQRSSHSGQVRGNGKDDLLPSR